LQHLFYFIVHETTPQSLYLRTVSLAITDEKNVVCIEPCPVTIQFHSTKMFKLERNLSITTHTNQILSRIGSGRVRVQSQQKRNSFISNSKTLFLVYVSHEQCAACALICMFFKCFYFFIFTLMFMSVSCVMFRSLSILYFEYDFNNNNNIIIIIILPRRSMLL